MRRSYHSFLAPLLCFQSAMVLSAAAGEAGPRSGGVNPAPGWALNRIGGQFSVGGSYAYPNTATPVRLYLIDTAVSDPGSFMTSNSNLLSFEGPILVGGAGSAPSIPRVHGTQLLSLITGINTGVAPGTPLHVVNYDIYPTPTTTMTLLSSAIIQAVRHHKDFEGPEMRSVICIATSSAEQASSSILDAAIDSALHAGITVVLSAGNLGQNASGIAPSSNGTKNGVICVGASDHNDFRLASSNFGAPVDLLAPGSGVPTRSQSATSEIVLMNDTSPATALVTGAVIAKLSASPTFTPAGIESSLKAAAETGASGFRLLRSIVPPNNSFAAPDVAPDGWITSGSSSAVLTWQQAPVTSPPPGKNAGETLPSPPDSNGDGVPDILGIFHGDPNLMPQGPKISLSENQTAVEFKFSIASDLFDKENPFVLRNGYVWQIRRSGDRLTWTIPTGDLIKSTENGRTYLTALLPVEGTACYARIEVVAP